ncbi:hypothetical protein CAI21_15525 [Alkalilimnicola ehrlichii]|uniref:Lipoprotein n=1 Tax=Alkalilimnicola ehrlichii TaxID=351052 RepID=A0A3E0WPG4_9GAMM|nr:hypothetical protein [Alkalilimnicola ehrlichii]RFA26975.1 hypothetical protein CAI21_15525 [Alkalilimnicola ehrlichii]RFA34093.1 hypothetical protein CAL65_15660 [Alkalilimnicola ehrlichii]
MRKLLAILAIAFPLAFAVGCDQQAGPGDQAGDPMGAPPEDQAQAPGQETETFTEETETETDDGFGDDTAGGDGW